MWVGCHQTGDGSEGLPGWGVALGKAWKHGKREHFQRTIGLPCSRYTVGEGRGAGHVNTAPSQHPGTSLAPCGPTTALTLCATGDAQALKGLKEKRDVVTSMF